MSYLVDCALIDTIEDLVDTDCSLRRTQTTCRRWITTWFSALGERTSLPGNSIQETLALPISKLTRSHWPKLSKKRRPIFSQHKQVEKCSFAVKHLEPLIREEKGVSKGGLIRERTHSWPDPHWLAAIERWSELMRRQEGKVKWRQWCSFFIWK